MAEENGKNKGTSGEKTIRSIVKTISWRTTGTIDTIVISFLITGKLDAAFAIGGIEVFTKIILYFFHERIWNKISWGKTTEDTNIEYHI